MIEVLTSLLVVITGVYAWVTFGILKANQRTVEAMQAQAEAATRPYITINVFSVPNNQLFYLKIANTGKTGADNVRFSLDREFYQYGETTRPMRQYSIFQQPIEHLSPGSELILGLAPGAVVLGDSADESITPTVFSITASYSYANKTVTETTAIDLRPYKQSMAPPSTVANELKKIREQLEKIAKKD
jgi:hypothetical protein